MFDYVPGHHYKEIMEEFNRRFPDTPITTSQVKGFVGRYHLNTGFTGRYEKGRISHNKGKKMDSETYEKIKHTFFKPGHKPINHREVGSTRENVDGYIEIKIKEPNEWTLYSRYVWEKENGPVKDGYCLLHKSGIKNDDRLENLVLLSRAELIRLNQSGFFTEGNIDINEVAINLAKLKNTIGNKTKGKKH